MTRVQVSGISSNLLLSLGLRGAQGASPFDLPAPSPAKSAAAATVLPASSGMVQLSNEMLFALQGEQQDEQTAQPASLEPPSVEDRFLAEARKNPMQRLREQVMKDLGVSEDDLANMSAEERRAAEDKIREMIEEKLKQGMDAANGQNDSDGAGALMLQAALA